MTFTRISCSRSKSEMFVAEVTASGGDWPRAVQTLEAIITTASNPDRPGTFFLVANPVEPWLFWLFITGGLLFAKRNEIVVFYNDFSKSADEQEHQGLKRRGRGAVAEEFTDGNARA